MVLQSKIAHFTDVNLEPEKMGQPNRASNALDLRIDLPAINEAMTEKQPLTTTFVRDSEVQAHKNM